MKHHTQFGLLIMLIASLGMTTVVTGQSTPPVAEEIELWQDALLTGETADIEAFLQRYPDSEFSAEARELLAVLASSSDESAIVQDGDAATTPVVGNAGKIPVFDQPLVTDVGGDKPRSIQQLIKGTPLYAPVEGLPPEYWQEEVCSNCHRWDKASLCTQGEFYAKQKKDGSQRIQHPYGGFFKKAVEQWAAGGCQ